jgi:hypothetical protein
MLRRVLHPKVLAKKHPRLSRGLETNTISENEENSERKPVHIPVMLNEVLHYLVDSDDGYQVSTVIPSNQKNAH